MSTSPFLEEQNTSKYEISPFSYNLVNIFDFSEESNNMLSTVLNEMEKRIMINN